LAIASHSLHSTTAAPVAPRERDLPTYSTAQHSTAPYLAQLQGRRPHYSTTGHCHTTVLPPVRPARPTNQPAPSVLSLELSLDLAASLPSPRPTRLTTSARACPCARVLAYKLRLRVCVWLRYASLQLLLLLLQHCCLLSLLPPRRRRRPPTTAPVRAMPPRAPLQTSFSVTDVNNEVVCPLHNQDGSHCRKRCLGVSPAVSFAVIFLSSSLHALSTSLSHSPVLFCPVLFSASLLPLFNVLPAAKTS
jgi:hypothetical protein